MNLEQKSPRPDWALERCITCYMCLAGCPVYAHHPELFLGPIGFVKLGNLLFSPVDVADRVKLAALSGVHHCDLCGTCQDVCPQHIKIVPLMRLLKSRSASRDLSDKYALPTKALHEMSEGFL
jgi:succinate dehydrogenase/fumarate reductase-like Fe-S protein